MYLKANVFEKNLPRAVIQIRFLIERINSVLLFNEMLFLQLVNYFVYIQLARSVIYDRCHYNKNRSIQTQFRRYTATTDSLHVCTPNTDTTNLLLAVY